MIVLVSTKGCFMFDVLCFVCEQDIFVSEDDFLFAASPADWVCDACDVSGSFVMSIGWELR